MTNSDMKTKKFPYIHQTGISMYRSICGRLRLERSARGIWCVLTNNYNGLILNVSRFDTLEEAHAYVEELYPELKTELGKLLMTDN